jgi:hypothetical protein
LAGTFNCAPLAEHAVELDPRHVDRPLVEALRRGVRSTRYASGRRHCVRRAFP